jgi:PIN domain nuclease of toxin-antitoxin system
VTTLLLDTHVLLWWTSQAEQLSSAATLALDGADELAVSDLTWLELARLVAGGRIVPAVPVRTWLEGLAREVRTLPVTPAIAIGAVRLPREFPLDPADRVIWATAVEHGVKLVSKDAALHAFDPDGAVVVW